ncbi:DUF461 domain-containing protein [Streptomyces sp. NPDC001222]|uniref:DUF461 domain-containing protein n=1 Tax=Streptomyces sp. NPDC001222 TaxID=3364548 RepID=UPI0036906EAE
MSSSLRRGALAAAAIAFSIASLAACGAGNDSQTLEIKPDNAATSVGVIKVQNALVITQPDPKATGPAVISATVFNSGSTDQTLDSISVDGDGTAVLSPAKGSGKLTVPAGGSLVIGGKGNASAVLDNVGASVKNGNAQKITFSFSQTGDVSLSAFVVPAESYFTKWGPSNIPTPTTTASPTVTTGAKPSKPATGSPAAGSSGKPGHKESGKPGHDASASATATASAGQ